MSVNFPSYKQIRQSSARFKLKGKAKFAQAFNHFASIFNIESQSLNEVALSGKLSYQNIPKIASYMGLFAASYLSTSFLELRGKKGFFQKSFVR